MAGSVDMVTRCYAGIEMRDGRLWFHPGLPMEITAVKFHLVYRDQALSVSLSQEELRITSAEGSADPIRVVVDGEEVEIRAGEARRFAL